jgi:hypothetical protein
MVVATPPPSGVRPEDIALRMERLLNKNAEERAAVPGLRPRVRYLSEEPHLTGELVFEISVSGEGYGGPMAVKTFVTQDQLTDWRWVETPFIFGRVDLLRLVSRRMDAERKAQDEEE